MHVCVHTCIIIHRKKSIMLIYIKTFPHHHIRLKGNKKGKNNAYLARLGRWIIDANERAHSRCSINLNSCR